MRTLRLHAGDSVAAAAKAIVGIHLRKWRAHEPGVRRGDDPEALHDLRVAVRRLRAAVRALAAGFPPDRRRSFSAELKWLGGLTGAVRDVDVQLEELPRRGAVADFRTYLEGERARRRGALLAGLDSQRYRTLVSGLEAFAGHRPRQDRTESIARIGRRAIKRAWHRLRRQGEGIRRTPTTRELHRLRIRAKRLRYLLEFLQDLTGKRGKRLIAHLVRLQDLLGAYHDAEMTLSFIHGFRAESGTAGRSALRRPATRARRIMAARRHDFQRVWHRFSSRRTVDEFKVLLRRLRAATGETREPTVRRKTGAGSR